MKVAYAILAQNFTFDASTQLTSLNQILEEATFNGLTEETAPSGIVAVPLESAFVVLWASENERERTELQHAKFWVDTPRGQWIEADISMDFQGNGRYRAVVKLPFFPMAGKGAYSFNMECQGTLAQWVVTGRFNPDLVSIPANSIPLTPKFVSR
jgi:hypothetical protein